MIPELLSPAGGLEALQAAVCAGADAVYLGGASFGARAAVGFSHDDLKAAARFAHRYGRRIYITVNTLVKDGEWDALRGELRFLADLGADAVLVQDLGVLKLCREEFPSLTLHASTQMTLHTPSGLRWAAAQGIRRVVMNREATLQDIRAAADTGIEVEVFAHGALCVSVSGQCALSASLGERSGNRGRCGQPCRLPYIYREKEMAWLSPADLCTLTVLPALVSAGAASLKLEGRLKRPEYVYIVTDAYRRALDGIADGKPGTEFDEDLDGLRQIFCRGRFTRGYAGGQQDAEILNPEHTAHQGIRIGTIQSAARRGGAVLARFTPSVALADQDGLTVGEDKCIYNGPPVPHGAVATLRLHQSAAPGTPVFRTESAAQFASARENYSQKALKRLAWPMRAEFRAVAGEPVSLALSACGVHVHVTGDIAEKASKQPLGEAVVRQALSKTGDSPFQLTELKADTDSAYLSSAQLNALRREGLAQLEEALIARNTPKPRGTAAPGSAASVSETPPSGRWFVRTEQPEEIPELLEAGADHILLSPKDITPAGIRQFLARPLPSEAVSLLLPPMADDAALTRLCEAAAESGIALTADNAGQLSLRPSISMAAGGVPVFNARTEALLRAQGIRAAVVSSELSGAELQRMPAPVLERIVPVYGRQRLMLLNHCPERVFRGLSQNREGCWLCESGSGLKGQALTDRKGLRLPLIPYRTDRGCIVGLYGGKPLSLLPWMSDLRRLPVSFLLSFTDEPLPERLRILRAFRSGAQTGVQGTSGKYLTGVL